MFVLNEIYNLTRIDNLPIKRKKLAKEILKPIEKEFSVDRDIHDTVNKVKGIVIGLYEYKTSLDIIRAIEIHLQGVYKKIAYVRDIYHKKPELIESDFVKRLKESISYVNENNYLMKEEEKENISEEVSS